jgi:hypothetical protein
LVVILCGVAAQNNNQSFIFRIGTKGGQMIEYQEHSEGEGEGEVDVREETIVTRQPGFTSTEQVVRDVAAERRMGWLQFNRIMWSMLVFLEILLASRILLRLIGANPNSVFTMLIYGITGLFVFPFNGMVATPTFDGSALEVTTLIAMIVYGFAFAGIAYVFRLFLDRTSASTFTGTTREQTSGEDGTVRTTHTTISDS